MQLRTLSVLLGIVSLILAGSAKSADQKLGDPPGLTKKPQCPVERRIPISPSDIPFTIDAPGSYYLTGDLTGDPTSSGTAITINASAVTVDLMGFAVSAAITGAAQRDVTIMNGHFIGPSGAVVLLGADVTLESLTVVNGAAIVLGANARVHRVSLDSSRQGLHCGNGCSVGQSRFFLDEGGNTALTVGTDSDVTDVNAVGEFGLAAGGGTSVSRSDIEGSDDGLIADGALDIADSRVGTSGDYAISAGDGSRIVRTFAGGGISWCVSVGTSSRIDGLTAHGSGDAIGLLVGDGSQVLNSLISGGGTDLQVGSSTTVLENTLLGYTGIGIRVSGAGNRIERNVISGKEVGLQIDGTDNAAFKNIAHGNTLKNYQIAAGNEVGPIGTMASSTSPWANASD